jgi:hypothetical protein
MVGTAMTAAAMTGSPGLIRGNAFIGDHPSAGSMRHSCPTSSESGSATIDAPERPRRRISGWTLTRNKRRIAQG